MEIQIKHLLFMFGMTKKLPIFWPFISLVFWDTKFFFYALSLSPQTTQQEKEMFYLTFHILAQLN